MSGTIEAAIMPCLLFQLLISIECNGNILLYTITWNRSINGLILKNPTDVVMKAGCMCLKLVLLFKVKTTNRQNLPKLEVLIRSTVEYLNCLFD